MQRLQVLPLNLFVVQEDAVDGAVDDRVEPILEPVQSCWIRDPQVDPRPSTLRVAFGAINRRRGAVNTRCRVALRREVDRVMARTRSRVEDLAAQSAICHQLLDRRLRFADVPRRQRRQAVQRPLITVQFVEVPSTKLICPAQDLAATTPATPRCLQHVYGRPRRRFPGWGAFFVSFAQVTASRPRPDCAGCRSPRS